MIAVIVDCDIINNSIATSVAIIRNNIVLLDSGTSNSLFDSSTSSACG
jgi:hypothetical protein